MKHNTVQIAITEKILAALINDGQIHAADFKCLDQHSKKTVWKLLLASVNASLKPSSS